MPRRSNLAHHQPSTSISSDPLPRSLEDNKPLPRLVVFDLDYTLWPFWVDTHVTPPIKPVESSSRSSTPTAGSPDVSAPGICTSVRDAYGGNYGFYSEVPGLLHSLRSKGIQVGAASRTSAPELARKMLSLLTVRGKDSNTNKSDDSDAEGMMVVKKAISMFDHLEIYPGSKTAHFQSLRKKSKIPFEEMLFFDDEVRNRNVESLGVVMYLVRDGVTRAEFDKGVESWRARNGREES